MHRLVALFLEEFARMIVRFLRHLPRRINASRIGTFVLFQLHNGGTRLPFLLGVRRKENAREAWRSGSTLTLVARD